MKLQTLTLDNAACWILGQALDKPNGYFGWVTDKYSVVKDVIQPLVLDRLNSAGLQFKFDAAASEIRLSNGSTVYLKVAHHYTFRGYGLDGVIVSGRVEPDVINTVATSLLQTRGWMYGVLD